MRALRRFIRRLTSWTHTQHDEERLRTEIEEHIEFQTADNIRGGLSPIEARRQAVLKFGAVEATKEIYRDQRGLPFLETLIRDTRHALRRLRMAPAFTIATILTLALGIGATTSIFTLAHAVLLKSLPVANPDELYRLGKEARCCYWNAYSQEKETSLVSYELYTYFTDNTKGFAELAAFEARPSLFGVRRSGGAEAAQSYPGEYVSGNYFAMFGINAYAGRMLAPEDDRANAAPAVVMSYRLWQQKYGSDVGVIGSVFSLDDRPFTVVGIAPPGFFGDTLRNTPPDFFLPLHAEQGIDGDLNEPDTAWLELIGRIQPGAQVSSLEAQMRVELQQWLRSHWGDMSANQRATLPEQTLYLRPGGAGISSMREQYEHWLQILMMVSGFVLLIVCANVANLMLVRGMERRRQISLSMALGARASRVVSQALSESIVLSLLGGAAGLGVAFGSTRLILHFTFASSAAGFAGVPISASPSMPVLLFALAVSVITGIASGMAPAWMATRVDPIDALRGAGRSTARTGAFSRKTLVVLQSAFSLALLTSSGLLTVALYKLEHQDFGFEQDRRIVANIDPSLAGYRRDQLTPLYQRIHDSLAATPGVESAAISFFSPLSGNDWGGSVWIDGRPSPGPKEDDYASMDRITAGFLEVVGNPIVRGRGISREDTPTSRHVAVVNEAFARKYFRGEDPIGKYFGRVENHSSRLYEIVGVARDARYLSHTITKPIEPLYFLPEAQHDVPNNDPGSHFLHDIVIAAKPGASVSVAQVSQALAAVDPNLPIVSIRPLAEQVSAVFSQQRLIARLTSLFGILSLVLACIGMYGVTAYSAGCRTNEIGVRMALGANRTDAVGLILLGAGGLIFFGLVAGLPLAFVAGRFLGSQLYGVNPFSVAVTSA
ncbi:MAG TPA: ABC transporter permease, partial [Bryobacteraceae bacterium]